VLRDVCSRAYELNYFMRPLFDPAFSVPDPRYFYVCPFPASATALLNAGFIASYPFDWSTTDTSAEVTLSQHQRAAEAE